MAPLIQPLCVDYHDKGTVVCLGDPIFVLPNSEEEVLRTVAPSLPFRVRLIPCRIHTDVLEYLNFMEYFN